MEIKEGRISNYTLRNLCIKNNWFTAGDNEQYDKLFQLNEMEATIERIATAIWMCSDAEKWCIRDIIVELNDAGFSERQSRSEEEHLRDWLGI